MEKAISTWLKGPRLPSVPTMALMPGSRSHHHDGLASPATPRTCEEARPIPRSVLAGVSPSVFLSSLRRLLAGAWEQTGKPISTDQTAILG